MITSLLSLLLFPLAAPAAEVPVDFNRDIRPLLYNNCIACHGPDEAARKADLRLDTEEGAFAALDGHAAIVKGKPEASALIQRITSTDASETMPPPKSGKTLSAADVELFKRWIRQGAAYQKHWAYVAPKRHALPAVKDQDRVRTPIDTFILARLQAEGLRLSAEADRFTLARRVALDLTGLPPTVAEADAFAKDARPDAYERYVDALLAKPSYGEHAARLWLDLARYADSAGYANDPPRTIWLYRDYVINAFNRNMPFDRFTIEQLAGDLLPNPTEEQTIATAFHRNTLTNSEGGTSRAEFRNAAVVDRVNTTMNVWMGTSMACAQCHTHKYDPISQKEYFQFFAFLNNTADADRADEKPVQAVDTPEQKKQRAEWTAQLATLDAKFKTPAAAVLAGQARWVQTLPDMPTWARSLAVFAPNRTPAQIAARTEFYVRQIAPDFKKDRVRIAALTKRIADMKPATVPIMTELAGGQRRKTHIQLRGNYTDLGDEVAAGVPAVLHPLPSDAPHDRLALARWLVAPDNPLTGRVIANRYWEQFFGNGLVRTSEEFGAQGDTPSHPELLDWLATELIRLKWDTKAFVKILVMSTTYRQSSAVTKAAFERDADNRLLSRGPRLRLTAEMVRDQALAASGLLSPKMFGPSVRPPQPELGISAAFGGSIDWKTSDGEDRHRRGLYTVWRRSNPYPSMSTFDAPNRDICMVRRNHTNTPLQALVTLNDSVYIEAAQALARLTVKEGGATTADRVRFAFRRCLTRPARDEELKRLVALYDVTLTDFDKDPARAKALATVPIGPVPNGMTAADLAAWTVVGNVLLNLDEALMKR